MGRTRSLFARFDAVESLYALSFALSLAGASCSDASCPPNSKQVGSQCRPLMVSDDPAQPDAGSRDEDGGKSGGDSNDASHDGGFPGTANGDTDAGTAEPSNGDMNGGSSSNSGGTGSVTGSTGMSGSEDAGRDASQGEADAGTGGDGGCALVGVDVMEVCEGPIVINEVDGSGEDFIELYNRSNIAINVGSYLIADDSSGSPNTVTAVVIPAGTMIGPQSFLYLWANRPPDPTHTGPDKFYDDCVPGAPPPCLHAEWGISASTGRVYLLKSTFELICAVSYPGVLDPGEAIGRIPDGSKMWCPTAPDPGRINVRSTLRDPSPAKE